MPKRTKHNAIEDMLIEEVGKPFEELEGGKYTKKEPEKFLKAIKP